MPSLSSRPLSHSSRIAEAGETSKPKKKAATFNSIPSLSACVRAAAPEPRASGEPGLLAAAGYFGGFVPRRDWNPPGCPVRITKLEEVQLCFGGWIRLSPRFSEPNGAVPQVKYQRLQSMAINKDTGLPSQLNDTLHNGGHR